MTKKWDKRRNQFAVPEADMVAAVRTVLTPTNEGAARMGDAIGTEKRLRESGHEEAATLYHQLRLHSSVTDDPAGALMWDAANMIARLALNEPKPVATCSCDHPHCENQH